jgi:hypothetical protein
MATPHPDGQAWPQYILTFAGGALLAFGFATLLGHWFPGTETCLRSSGGVLQLVGLAAVAWGIASVRRSYGLPSISLEVMDELGQAIGRGWTGLLQSLGVRRPPPIIIGAGAATVGAISARGRATVRPGSDATVQRQLDLLFQLIDRIEQGLDQAQSDLEQEVKRRTQAVATERQDRETAVENLHLELRTYALGGIRLQVIGVGWLLLSIIFTTWSHELEPIVSRVHFGCIDQPSPPPSPPRWF